MSFDASFSPNGMTWHSPSLPPDQTTNPSPALTARSIFKRCVKCETSAPSCPVCDKGSTCTMISQSCDHCATTKCIKTSSGSSSGSQDDSSGGGGGPGAIAGGVIGGIAFVTILVALVWWFFIRKKRNEYSLGAGGNDGQEKRRTNAQQSRKSNGSIASTVLTRASNVIQIAYIPGVTNRSPPGTPSSLVPPVPPLPGAAPDQHFFMPGDLRDSSFTDMSNDRRSGAPSVSPSLRSSVAASAYRSNAIVSPVPAQQATLTRGANVVSIHGSQPGMQTAVTTPSDAPAVPAITQAQLAKAGVTDANNNNNNNNSSIVARTMMAKPVMVKTVGGKKNNDNAAPAVQTIEEQSESNSSAPVSRDASTTQQADMGTSGFDASSDEEDDGDGVRSTKGSTKTKASTKRKTAATVTEEPEPPTAEQGPFSDQPAIETQTRTSTHLETNDGTASKRSSNRSSNRAPPPRVESPFSDANEVK